MRIFLIVLLCVMVVLFYYITVHIIADKIKKQWLSLLVIIGGSILSFGFLFLIAMLGKQLDILGETAICIVFGFWTFESIRTFRTRK